MLAPLQTGAARFSSYLLSRARKVLGSHLFSPCGVPEFCSISTRKLAAHGFGASMAAMVSFPPQRYHYFLVLDFEATCDKPQIHPQEIIEFPILKLNGRTMEIESTFHMYVQPVVHPQLTPFCTELTGIIQAMVDGQPSLQQVLERVDEWMAKEGLLDPNVKSIFVTCGDWDLKVMLPGQCQYLGLPVADYFKQWINLKKVCREIPMKGVLQVLAQSSPSALSCTASGRDVLLAESRKSVPSDVKVTLDPPGWPWCLLLVGRWRRFGPAVGLSGLAVPCLCDKRAVEPRAHLPLSVGRRLALR
uniref:ERI1 exoribonuclease family member 3 n=1 Tax=Sus scrofa TaxID=9823 RepID=A0A8D1IRA0_PIG